MSEIVLASMKSYDEFV